MQPRNRHDPDTKAEALRLVAEVGPCEAARRLGIPEGTVKSWARRAGISSPNGEQTAKAVATASVAWAVRRAALVDEMGRAATKAVARLNERLDGDTTTGLRDLAVSAAVMIDKAQLLSGQATGRTEAAHTVSDERKAKAVAVFDELAHRRSA